MLKSIREVIKKFIPIGWRNYYRYLIYSKYNSHFHDSMTLDTFSRIYKTNHWRGSESICGETSGIKATESIRKEFPQIFEKYQIKSILDIPCGDFTWMSKVDLSNMFYKGADIVPEMIHENKRKYTQHNITFEVIDLTKADLPVSDLIICRDCFVHFSFEHIFKALKNIIYSQSTYLLCTSFIENRFNYDINTGDWRTLNMQIAPFYFSNPLEIINESCLIAGNAYRDKAICLWKIDSIQINQFY